MSEKEAKSTALEGAAEPRVPWIDADLEVLGRLAKALGSAPLPPGITRGELRRIEEMWMHALDELRIARAFRRNMGFTAWPTRELDWKEYRIPVLPVDDEADAMMARWRNEQPPITRRQFDAALERGRKDREAAEAATTPFSIDPNLRFRR